MMKISRGATLIELLIFIVVVAIVISTLFLTSITILKNVPVTQQLKVATLTAEQCMEWFLGQRRMAGYSALSCPSTPSATACSAPTGYTVTTSIACTTWNSDAAYKTITVSVTGLANASYVAQVGDF